MPPQLHRRIGHAMFRSPQINIYSRDLTEAQSFYASLGFKETFRTPSTGNPSHVELQLDSNAENSLRTHREPSAMVLVATGTIHGDCGKSCAKRREDQHTRMFLNVN